MSVVVVMVVFGSNGECVGGGNGDGGGGSFRLIDLLIRSLKL